jgi:hypothetical protein
MQIRQIVKPLSSLIRQTPDAPLTLEAKLAALDSATPELLLATALSEEEDALRTAAIRKLPGDASLYELAGLTPETSPLPASLHHVAQERVAHLIDAGTLDFGALGSVGASSAALLSVAGLCHDAAHVENFLTALNNEDQVAHLAVEGSSSRIRQLAAQRVENPDQLRQILKLVRDKDKNVYKIIKQKVDALRAEEHKVIEIEAEIQTAYASLERHSHRIYDSLFVPSFEHFHSRWQAVEAHATEDMRGRATDTIARCKDVITKHDQLIAEKAAETARQEALAATRREAKNQAESDALQRQEAAALADAQSAAAREQEQKARAELAAAEAHMQRQLSGLIGKTHAALREGDTGRAAGLRKAIDEKLPKFPVVPPHLAAQVRDLDAKLKELKQWKDFAVAPKRAELIQEMEALIGSTEAPQALADKIKQLQEDWKTISKGIVSDSEADWQRFHLASQSAYKPCREHFEAQAQVRKDNLAKRRVIIDRVLAFEAAQSAENPDWRSFTVVLREAPLEWRHHTPVERAAGRVLQEEFDAVISRLQQKLGAWYASNAAEKQALIKRAQQLIGKEAREATDAVKQLQQQWKGIGIVERDQEQRLWNEFREHCDAVFQKRAQVQTERMQALDSNKVKALAICEEAEQMAALSGPALLEGLAKIPQWRTALEALGELPRADERNLRDRFDRAIKRGQGAVAAARTREKEMSMSNLLQAAHLIQSYGWAVSQGAEGERDTSKQAAETFIASIQTWPKGGAQALKEAWARAEAAKSAEAAAHERSLRILCIRSEMAGGRSTPAEDQALRREFQMQRLVERMGQAHDANAEAPDSLAMEWLRVGAVSPTTHEALLARFVVGRKP